MLVGIGAIIGSGILGYFLFGAKGKVIRRLTVKRSRYCRRYYKVIGMTSGTAERVNDFEIISTIV